MTLTAFVFLATLLTTSFAESDVFNRIQQLQSRSGTGGLRVEGLDCQSWRLAVETNNLKGWKLVPESCEDYIGKYMLGKHYRDDCKAVANAAIEYVYGVVPAPDGRDAWVFDIDETTLSNIPYYARTDVLFGGEADKDTSAVEYKSKKRRELVNEGYIIVGNVGDQWSGLIGTNPGNRTFKVPDPLYYIA